MLCVPLPLQRRQQGERLGRAAREGSRAKNEVQPPDQVGRRRCTLTHSLWQTWGKRDARTTTLAAVGLSKVWQEGLPGQQEVRL